MLLLRIAGLLAAIAFGASAVLYLLSGERKYLRIAIDIARYALAAMLGVFALMLFERLAVLV